MGLDQSRYETNLLPGWLTNSCSKSRVLSSVSDEIVLEKKNGVTELCRSPIHMLVNFKFNILDLNLTFWIHLLTNSL